MYPFQLIIYIVVVMGLDMLRILVGPLPDEFCFFNNFSKTFFILTITLIIAIIAALKFFFLCVIKRFPEIDDEKMTQRIVAVVLAVGLVASGVQNGMDRKPSMSEVSICNSFLLKM